MKQLAAIFCFAILNACANPAEKAVCKVGVTINGKPYQVVDGTKISYREPNGRFAALKVEIPQ